MLEREKGKREGGRGREREGGEEREREIDRYRERVYVYGVR